MRDQVKYDGLAAFGRSLPSLRARIAAGLRAEAGSRELALAAVLALLDRAALRVGAAGYARENKSYGATTLLGRHITFDDSGGVTLEFPGKGGRPVSCHLHGPRLQRALHDVRDLPGAELIGWQDADGAVHALRSDDVNAKLEDICGEGTTTKTFRSWNGTHAAFTVAEAPGGLSIRTMAEAAAERLCNTPAISRSSYIHPKVIDLAALNSAERLALLKGLPEIGLGGLRAHEDRLIAFLEQ